MTCLTTTSGPSWTHTSRRTTSDHVLRQAIGDTARTFYGEDTDSLVTYEPSGPDFLSPFYAEAVLVSEVLDSSDFGPWWAGFAPAEFPERFLTPAIVTDPQDGQGAHLHAADDALSDEGWMAEHWLGAYAVLAFR